MEQLTELEKGYLFGLFEGDGYKYHNIKGRRFEIYFFLNSIRDLKIIDLLITLLKKINLNVQVYQDKRFNCKRISVYSKELFYIIKKDISLDKMSIEFNIGYVSGIIDSEGYVSNKSHSIQIVNTNKNVG